MAISGKAMPRAAWMLAPGTACLRNQYRWGAQANGSRSSAEFHATTNPGLSRIFSWQSGIDRLPIQAIQGPAGSESEPQDEQCLRSPKTF